MSDIDNSKLRRLDLTVLLVFLGLLRHRKATLVAGQLGLTQSAISHALRRLREAFGDELFLRRPHGMEPTTVAAALEPQVRLAVDALRDAVGGARSFDPATATGTLNISAWDSVQSLVAPGLVARLLSDAPGLRLRLRMLARPAALDALAAGEIDLALGYFRGIPDNLLSETLYDESYLVAGRPDVIGAELTLARFLDLPHVLVSPQGDFSGIVDVTLAARGESRRVVAAIPQFFPALATVAATGAVATLPADVARRYAPAFGLALAPPPLPLRRFAVSALRHRRNASDPRLAWVTDALRDIVKVGNGPAGGGPAD